MKEKIPALIAFCNQSILAWYHKEFPKDIGDFTPVDKNDPEVIDTIYNMYLLVKADTNVQMLMPVIKYYFAISVVEYYVLEYACPLFNEISIKQMVGLSLNTNISKYRQRMMGFNSYPFRTVHLRTPFPFEIPTRL